MRTYIAALVVGIFCLMNAGASHAGTGSFMFGYLIGSSGQSSKGASSADVIYMAPAATMEQVSDPLAVRQDVSENLSSRIVEGMTLQEVFNRMIGNDAGKYVILQAVRVIDPSYVGRAYMWFTFIEKSKLVSTEKAKANTP